MVSLTGPGFDSPRLHKTHTLTQTNYPITKKPCNTFIIYVNKLSLHSQKPHRGVEQLVARRAHIRRLADEGSSLSPVTEKTGINHLFYSNIRLLIE